VVGDADPFTAGAARRFRHWAFFARSVQLISLPAAGHYFVANRAPDLARLMETLGGAGGPESPPALMSGAEFTSAPRR
jgi:hypothetical protein